MALLSRERDLIKKYMGLKQRVMPQPTKEGVGDYMASMVLELSERLLEELEPADLQKALDGLVDKTTTLEHDILDAEEASHVTHGSELADKRTRLPPRP